MSHGGNCDRQGFYWLPGVNWFDAFALASSLAGVELAPRVGFEPTTKRLTAARSTTELLGSVFTPLGFSCKEDRYGYDQASDSLKGPRKDHLLFSTFPHQ